MKVRIISEFAEREEHPLFYVESGSRLWGMAGKESDFDVRGFHMLSKRQYFDFKNHRDVVEKMENDLDLVSFDIDKAFGLLLKSNPTVFEWIRSDIIYYNILPDWEELKKTLIEQIDHKALYHHYMSMAFNNYKRLQKNQKFTYKTVLYCVRGILSAEIAAEHKLPGLSFESLLQQKKEDDPLAALGEKCLHIKKKRSENREIPDGEKNEILKTLELYLQKLSEHIPENSGSKLKMRALLREYSYHLKSIYYSE